MYYITITTEAGTVIEYGILDFDAASKRRFDTLTLWMAEGYRYDRRKRAHVNGRNTRRFTINEEV